MKKSRGAPHTGKGHGGSARQSRRGHRTALDVFEKSSRLVKLKCQSCNATANATVYSVSLSNPHADTKSHPLQEKQSFKWVWVQLPPNWWSYRYTEDETPLFGLCGPPYRCSRCVGGNYGE